MSQFSYHGSHSILIGGKDTWSTFHLIPTEMLYVAPPEPKTEYVDIPGANGQLDYTGILNGLKFKNREGSWSFYIDPEYHFMEVYNNLLSYLHGKVLPCILRDEPKYYYYGRLTLGDPDISSDDKPAKITINYNFEPYKYPSGYVFLPSNDAENNDLIGTDHGNTGYDGQGSLDTSGFTGNGDIPQDTPGPIESDEWHWNDLFDNVITYGPFYVAGSKERNLYNPTSGTITPMFYCTSEMKVIFGEKTYTLAGTTTTNSGIVLQPGDNNMTFVGYGNVVVSYGGTTRI